MPYGKKLTDTEIAARMVELRNLRRLHAHDRKQIATLKAQVRVLVQEKADDRAYFEALIQKQAIQIAELQTMVFGKKKQPPMGGTPIGVPHLFPSIPQFRAKDSYRRPLPPASTVTAEVAMPLPAACSCGGSFAPAKKTIHERFVEDIPLPELTPGYQAKLVTKYVIERGRCLACGKAATGGNRGLGGQAVTFGPNVRLLVTHLVSLVGMSYAQVTNLLLSLYGLVVSDGEVASILREKYAAWLPAYSQLKADIRAAPVRHYDETPWAIQAEQGAGYAWVMAAHGSPNTLFHCATSRGAPHAKRLHGKGGSAVHISDDYQAYRTLPGSQQLCWVHLYRVIRDLRYNTNLPEEQLPYVAEWYASFAGIYQDLRQYLGEPYDEVVRATQAAELWQRVQTLANQAPPGRGKEPQKLTRLRAQLLRAGKDRLFVCLPKNTPCDNNRAERDLRQLVLKRKRSFGSKTERGARALATVLSLCTTTWRTAPQGYFRALAALG